MIEKSRNSNKFKEVAERAVITPNWVDVDTGKLEGKITALSVRENIDLPIEEHLIIELYSK